MDEVDFLQLLSERCQGDDARKRLSLIHLLDLSRKASITKARGVGSHGAS